MRLTSQLISIIILMAVCFLSTASYAESGLYLGGSIGSTKIGVEPVDDFDPDFSLSDNDQGYKLFAGLKFSILAVEAGYVDFGKIDISGSDHVCSAGVSGFNAFGVLALGAGPVDLFAKAGGFVWEADYEGIEAKLNDDGFDPVVGVGASFSFGSLGIRAEYEYYDIEGFDDLSMVSVGLSYFFL